MGFSVVEWHKETNGKNVLECPQDSSLVEANKWITAAREDFGICGYFVAYKWSFEIHNNCIYLWEQIVYFKNVPSLLKILIKCQKKGDFLSSIQINCTKLI